MSLSSAVRLTSVTVANSYRDGVYLYNGSHFELDTVKVVLGNAAGNGVYIGGASDVRARNLYGGNAGTGIWLTALTNCVLQNVYSTSRIMIRGGVNLVVQGATAFWMGEDWTLRFQSNPSASAATGGNFFSHFLAPTSGGAHIDGMSRSTFSNLAVQTVRNDDGLSPYYSLKGAYPAALQLENGSYLKFVGNILANHTFTYAQDCQIGPGDTDFNDAFDESWSSVD